MTDEIAPAKFTSLASLLRNPLVVYGLILVAGDGPLTIGYIMSKTPEHATIFMWLMAMFIFGMGGVFCYLVLFKPRHLYHPGEIPESSFGKSIYSDFIQTGLTFEDRQHVPELKGASFAPEQTEPVAVEACSDELKKAEDKARYWFLKFICASLGVQHEVALAHMIVRREMTTDELLKSLTEDPWLVHRSHEDLQRTLPHLRELGLITEENGHLKITDTAEEVYAFESRQTRPLQTRVKTLRETENQ